MTVTKGKGSEPAWPAGRPKGEGGMETERKRKGAMPSRQMMCLGYIKHCQNWRENSRKKISRQTTLFAHTHKLL